MTRKSSLGRLGRVLAGCLVLLLVILRDRRQRWADASRVEQLTLRPQTPTKKKPTHSSNHGNADDVLAEDSTYPPLREQAGFERYWKAYSAWVGELRGFHNYTRPLVEMPSLPDKASVALVTFPNSGTTWLRQMWSASTGIRSYSTWGCGETRFDDIRASGFLCASDDEPGRLARRDEAVIAKSHADCYGVGLAEQCNVTSMVPVLRPADAIVRTVRNPMDNFVARARHSKRTFEWMHDFATFVNWHFRFDVAMSILKQPVMLVEFYALLEDTEQQLRNVLFFSGHDREAARRGIEQHPNKKATRRVNYPHAFRRDEFDHAATILECLAKVWDDCVRSRTSPEFCLERFKPPSSMTLMSFSRLNTSRL